MKRKKVSILIFLLYTFIALSFVYGEELRLDGRVYEATNKKSIAALTVKLIPPKSVRKSEKVVSTDEKGEFHFTNIDQGKYLIEVYQGITILYRNMMEINQNTRKDIALRRKD